MPRRDCGLHFRRPKIAPPAIETCEPDEVLAKRLAAEIGHIVMTGTSGEADMLDPCSLAARARRRFGAMSEKERTLALRFTRALTKESDRSTKNQEDIDPDLIMAVRHQARRQLETTRSDINSAIKDLAEQTRGQAVRVTKTSVKMRPAGEVFVTPTRYMQLSGPESLTFHWETEEARAARAYWELRGPVTSDEPGRLLARGFAENMFDDGRVGGEYTLHLNAYLPPVTPNPSERYHMNVLPLAEAGKSLTVGQHADRSISSMALNEPGPPIGVGPWSAPAVIDYGEEYRQEGTQFDIERVSFYRKSRVNLNWFKVDADQPGPGDEEYHISAFVVEQTPLGSTALGTFGTYLPVEEGDSSRHTLGWKSYIHDLGEPITNLWPRIQFVVMSVLEEDAGDGVDEWLAAMVELASEALEGDLMDEVNDYLRDMQEELDEATDEFRAALADEFVKYASALINATAVGAVIAIIAYFVALISTFAAAGALDDFYGVKVVTLGLVTNNAARLKDGSGATVSAPLWSSEFSGQESGDRFEMDEIEVQLIAPGEPDAAGLGGIVTIGLNWEFYDKVTRYY